jgi:hypothetical protein
MFPVLQTTTRRMAQRSHTRFHLPAATGSYIRSLSSSLKDSYENILVETIPATAASDNHKNVALITLNRPKALNALNDGLFADLLHATHVLDDDSTVRCMVLTGSPKAFAAGADISEMKDKTYEECFENDMFAEWQSVSRLKTPIIAAVSGFCLGGGCELAMMCDLMVCSQSAKVRKGGKRQFPTHTRTIQYCPWGFSRIIGFCWQLSIIELNLT